MKHLISLLILLLALPLSASAKDKIRVACVGNSVTFGYGLPDRDTQSYPVRLQQLLGDGYDVQNFGRSSATLLAKGHLPYIKQQQYADALAFRADIVVIHLGLNDTDPRNWPQHGDDFNADYMALIKSFRDANPKARVYICLMTPIFHDHKRFDSGTREWHALIQKHIAQVAKAAGTGLIDLYTPLHCRPDLFPDALHPNPEGAEILAKTVHSALTGNYGGLSLPATYGDGMVMQRDRDFNIHGTANAGEKVSVRFLGQTQTTVAGADGKWSVPVKAQPASGPYTLTVKASSGTKTINDIWFGEVWLASGQSNMAFMISEMKDGEAHASGADTLSRLHLFNMPVLEVPAAYEWDPARLDSINRLQYFRAAQWERPSREAAMRFSAIGYLFGRALADSLGIHVGVICNAVGGSGVEDWIDRTTLETYMPAVLRDWKNNDYLMDWSRGRAKLNLKKSTNPYQRHPYEPAYLFEAGIAPLEAYPVRGVLWYQGESNAHNVELYGRLFTLLEQSWREAWGRADMPFYTVQLSSISPRRSWPAFRNEQRRLALTLPHTYIAVSADLGDTLNVHPWRKAPVADRLTRLALHNTYGRRTLPAFGPTYAGFTQNGQRLVVRFNNVRALRAQTGVNTPDAVAGRAIAQLSDTPLVGFEVAGTDGIFHAATATIQGTTVIVESAEVAEPVAVRYAWQPFTHANLTDENGIPASTFISE